MTNDIEKYNEMQSPFDAIAITDENGKKWWNSRALAHTLGYDKYWNFGRIMEKAAAFLQKNKGLNPDEHFVEIEEMAKLGSGSTRLVKSFLLSDVAVMAVVSNSDKKKPMVAAAIEHFGSTLEGETLSVGLQSNILLYKSSAGTTKVEVIYNSDTFWLSQSRMASLFGVDVSTINYHLHNIDESGEIHLSDAVRKIPMAVDKWSEESPLLYNLDAVIAVGYRVNSYEATQFRIWATSVLKEFIRKGFVMDDDRLKAGSAFGNDYFEELLERIREIRTSERRYYQKITDIYSECSSDYDSTAETTKTFFKTVQNIMHWAVTHQTAAEIVYNRADADKPNMGLMTWKNAPDGRIVRSDVSIAKNYLSEDEIDNLNMLTVAFLDMAEARARRHILMTMADWTAFLKKFIEGQDYELLQNAGSISHEMAVEKSNAEYDKYLKIQDLRFKSDFDLFISEMEDKR